MAFAIIKTGGKQYRVSQGDKLNIEKLDAEARQAGGPQALDKGLQRGPLVIDGGAEDDRLHWDISRHWRSPM